MAGSGAYLNGMPLAFDGSCGRAEAATRPDENDRRHGLPRAALRQAMIRTSFFTKPFSGIGRKIACRWNGCFESPYNRHPENNKVLVEGKRENLKCDR